MVVSGQCSGGGFYWRPCLHGTRQYYVHVISPLVSLSGRFYATVLIKSNTQWLLDFTTYLLQGAQKKTHELIVRYLWSRLGKNDIASVFWHISLINGPISQNQNPAYSWGLPLLFTLSFSIMVYPARLVLCKHKGVLAVFNMGKISRKRHSPVSIWICDQWVFHHVIHVLSG